MGKEFSIYQVEVGTREVGCEMRCTDTGNTALKTCAVVNFSSLTCQSDLYEGSFERDVLSGHGKLLHSNGDYYDGMWKNGLKHGYGTYDLDSVGLRYEGFWKNVGSSDLSC